MFRKRKSSGVSENRRLVEIGVKSPKSQLAAPSANSPYMQGYFPAEKAKKYVGNQPIVYRSSLEFIFIQRLENSPSVAKWSSEQTIIPYQMKENNAGHIVTRTHHYYTDFTVIMTNGRRYIIEIKPAAYVPLTESQVYENSQSYKNACKWKAALDWCAKNGYTFKVVTEETLHNANIFND
jgi:hypothetical protein